MPDQALEQGHRGCRRRALPSSGTFRRQRLRGAHCCSSWHDHSTLLLTDVVDSTRAGRALRRCTRCRVLGRARPPRARLLARHRGREIDRTDGFFLLFDDARMLPTTRSRITDGLADLGLKARVGLHVGPITLRENSLDDVAVAQTYRGRRPCQTIRCTRHGLARRRADTLSAAAREALATRFPRARRSSSHGHYRLKGIEEPIEIFELGVRDSSPFSPPADADKAYRVVARGGPLASRSRGPPQPSRRTRRVCRQDYGVAFARCAARRRRPPAHGPGSGRHRQDSLCPPLWLDLARRLAGRHLLLRSLRGSFARRHLFRRRLCARGPSRQG